MRQQLLKAQQELQNERVNWESKMDEMRNRHLREKNMFNQELKKLKKLQEIMRFN